VTPKRRLAFFSFRGVHGQASFIGVERPNRAE
jgi:hypothetical protein